VLYFVSSTVNPILYNVKSKRYKEAFKETICHCRRKRTLNLRHSSVHHYSSTILVQRTTNMRLVYPLYGANMPLLVAEMSFVLTLNKLILVFQPTGKGVWTKNTRNKLWTIILIQALNSVLIN